MSLDLKFSDINDIPGILGVLNENLLCDREKTVPKETLESKGFLIHAFTAEEIKNSISNRKDHIILVAKEGENILGYTIGYELENSRPDWFARIDASSAMMSLISSGKGLHLRHIAVSRGLENKKIGRQLLHFLLEEAKSKGCSYAICKIAQLPIHNRASAVFHEKMGFWPIGTVKDKKDPLGTFLLYFKKL